MEGKLIVENPISSSTGAAFLLWTVAVYGEDGFDDFWRELKPTIHSVQAGWDTAYDAFLNGEAPMVVSYGLDTAYSVYYSTTPGTVRLSWRRGVMLR